MKIAFIGQKGIPAKIGGVERHVDELASGLVARGHEVFAYVRDHYTDPKLTEHNGVRLIHLPSIPTKNLDAITHTFLATVHAVFSDYDVVHYQAIGPSSLSWIIRILRPKTAVIATFHCQDYFHQKWGLFARTYLRFSEYLTCRVPDKVITASKSLAGYAWEKMGRRADYVPNGFKIRKTEKFDELSRWDLEKNGYILSVGRLIRHKGVHYLVDAFKRLEDEGKSGNKKLVIVGDGAYTDDYVAELKKLAEGRKNIIFVGSQTGESLDQLFSHAAIFVQPSDSEGLSIALLEAMAHGKVIVSSDIPENREPLKDAGVFFANGDPSDLKRQLEFVIQNPLVAFELGQAAKSRAAEEYEWQGIINKTESIYHEALKEKTADKK